MLTRQIAHKTTETRTPVENVDPSETSITCRKCGETNSSMRTGDEFVCARWGGEVHADVNAAINIVQRGERPEAV
jgi:Transposase and inactivated derivatives